MSYIFSGKSLICKEKAVQKAEMERNSEEDKMKPNAGHVYFISMVGVDSYGSVEEFEYIFDIYTKEYDFRGYDVTVISAQDLWEFYASKNKRSRIKDVKIYFLVEYFVRHHPDGHFIVDECPLLKEGK